MKYIKESVGSTLSAGLENRISDDLLFSISQEDYITSPDDLINSQINEMTEKKVSNLILADAYTILGFWNKAYRVRDCGTLLDFGINYEDHTDTKLLKANFCKDRFCPQCANRKSKKVYGQISKIMDQIEKNYSFIFLTLTVKNCRPEDLLETVQMMEKGWRNLTNRKKGRDFQKIALGIFRTLEITIQKDNGYYHPHFHLIIAVDKNYFKSKDYLSQKRFTEIWADCCGLDYDPVCHVIKVKNRDKGVKEVSKYCVKPSDILGSRDPLNASYILDDLLVLKRKRFLTMTGIIKQIHHDLNLEDVESDDVDLTDLGDIRPEIKYLIRRYRWDYGFNSYVQYSSEKEVD